MRVDPRKAENLAEDIRKSRSQTWEMRNLAMLYLCQKDEIERLKDQVVKMGSAIAGLSSELVGALESNRSLVISQLVPVETPAVDDDPGATYCMVCGANGAHDAVGLCSQCDTVKS